MDIPDLDLPPPAKMSRRKKWWIAIVLLGIFGGIAFLWLKDDALEDDSDLVLNLPDVSEEENGMRFFDEVAEQVDLLDEDLAALNMMLPEDGKSEWDSDFARTQVEHFGYALDALENASLSSGLYSISRARETSDEQLNAIGWINVIRNAKFRLLLEQKKYGEAANLELISVRLICLSFGRSGEPLHVLWGMMDLDEACRHLEAIVTEETFVWEGEGRRVMELIKEARPDFDGEAKNDLIRTYGWVKSYLLEVIPSKTESLESSLFFYKPSRTVNVFADYVRLAQKQIGKTYAARISVDYRPKGKVSAVLGANLIGEIALMETVYQLDQRWQLRTVSYFEVLRTMISLRSYHADHRKLPEQLKDLVPVYLDAVPTDRFDGKALRYSKGEVKVWCVGEDLVDEGGIETDETEFSQMPDPMMQLKWLAEEE